MNSQPLYAGSIPKSFARIRNPKIFKILTGRFGLKSNEKYITLSNIQNETKNSEINQIVAENFCTKKQFVGIDNDRTIIKFNRKKHPEAKWIYGDWSRSLSSIDFSGGLIYFDSTNLAEKDRAFHALKKTLEFADHPETVVIANVMMNNPHVFGGSTVAGQSDHLFDPETLINNIFNDNPYKWHKWNRNEEDDSHCYVPSYEYKTTNKTLMRSYIFFHGIMSEKKIELINNL
jgi:hypothetical protein